MYPQCRIEGKRQVGWHAKYGSEAHQYKQYLEQLSQRMEISWIRFRNQTLPFSLASESSLPELISLAGCGKTISA